jgi:hypothetical protein
MANVIGTSILHLVDAFIKEDQSQLIVIFSKEGISIEESINGSQPFWYLTNFNDEARKNI